MGEEWDNLGSIEIFPIVVGLMLISFGKDPFEFNGIDILFKVLGLSGFNRTGFENVSKFDGLCSSAPSNSKKAKKVKKIFYI
jgi:hypothetical protein